MRRIAVALLACLGCAAFAHAAAHDWTYVGAGSSETAFTNAPSGTTFTFAALVSPGEAHGADLMASVSLDNKGAMAQLMFSALKDGDAWTWNMSSMRPGEGGMPQFDSADGDLTVTDESSFILGIAVAQGESNCTVNLSVNGEQVHRFTVENTFIEALIGDGFQAYVANNEETPVFFLDGQALSAADIVDSVEAITIPEPTAVALLALGVAGLALRRRAA